MIKYRRLQRFSGLQNTRSELDEPAGAMRRLTNVVPVPQGSLSSSPQWERVYQAIGPDSGVYQVVDGDFTAYVAYTEGYGVTDFLITTQSKIANAAPSARPSAIRLHAYSATQHVFLSEVGKHVIVGDGENANAIFFDNGIHLQVPLPLKTELYTNHKYPIPPCSMFVRAADLSIYAAGNKKHPLRVWVSEPTDALSRNSFGIASPKLSYVDIECHDATRVTSLSVYRNVVVCHTDGGVVLLEKPKNEQASTGWRVEQTPTSIKVGAYSARSGVLPYFLGSDGQLYRNDFQGGPEGIAEPQAETTATWTASGVWDETIKYMEGSFLDYNEVENWLILGSNVDLLEGNLDHPIHLIRGRLFENTRQQQPEVISGPHFYPRFRGVKSVPNSSHVLAIDGAGNFWTTDLRRLRDDQQLIPLNSTPIEESPRCFVFYDPSATTLVLGNNAGQAVSPGNGQAILVSAQLNLAFEDRVAGIGHSYFHPIGERIDGFVPDDDAEGEWFEGYVLAAFETAFDDLGATEAAKQFKEVILNFAPGSVGYLGVFVETDAGINSGKWIGEIEGRDTVKVFPIARGKKVRVRVYMLTEVGASWTINDVTVGYIPETAV